MGTYKLLVCTPALRKKVSQYYIQNWDYSNPRLSTYLDWIHDRNPFFEEPLIYIALHKEQVVGMRAAVGTCWESGDGQKRMVLPDMTDSGVAGGYRDGGLFRDLSDFTMQDLASRNYPCVLNLSPNPPNYVVSVMTMGWKPLGSSETMSRRTPSKPIAAGMLSSSGNPGIVGRTMDLGVRASRKLKSTLKRNKFADLDRNARHNKPPLTVSRQPRPQEMAELIQQLGGDGRIRHVRDADYFAWRFQNPYFQYRFLFWGDKELEGFMVLRNMKEFRTNEIVQWEGKDPQIRAGLLEGAIALGRFPYLEVWGASLSPTDLKVLQEAGFTYNSDSPTQYRRQNFMIKPLGQTEGPISVLGQDPMVHNNWNFQTVFHK